MGLTLVTPATVFPVTLAEAKSFCRVTTSTEDTLITSLIPAATKYVEEALSLSIAEQTWKLTLDAFTSAIELPRGPVTSVDTVTYADVNGADQAASPDLYTVDLTSDRQWLVLNSSESWPSTLNAVNAVSVTYTAGMELEQAHPLRLAILFLVAHYYERNDAAVPGIVDDLMSSYRRVFV